MRTASTLTVFTCYMLGFFWCLAHPELHRDCR
jgi:hypothetical protein